MKKSIKRFAIIASAIAVLLATTLVVLSQFNIHFASVDAGESEMIRADFTIGASSYFSSNESVATIDESGCVTGLKSGISLITIKSGVSGEVETIVYRVESNLDDSQEATTQNVINAILIFFVSTLAMFGISKLSSVVNGAVKMCAASQAVTA